MTFLTKFTQTSYRSVAIVIEVFMTGKYSDLSDFLESLQSRKKIFKAKKKRLSSIIQLVLYVLKIYSFVISKRLNMYQSLTAEEKMGN